VSELVAMGVIAGLLAFGVAYATRPHGATRAPARAATLLDGRSAIFELHAAAGRVTVRSRDGALSRDVDLAIVVDGEAHSISIARDDLRPSPDALRAAVPVPLGETEASLELRIDPARDALSLQLVVHAGAEAAGHSIALRAEMSSEGQVVFVPGVGQLADRASVTGGSLVVDADPHPIGVVSRDGPLVVDALIEDPLTPADLMRVAATSPAHVLTDRPDGTSPAAPQGGREMDQRVADLRIAVGQTSQTIWRNLAELAGLPTVPVRGRVTGTTDRALVFGRDAQSEPQVRAHAHDDGSFELAVPATVVQWYAAIEPGRASGVASFSPGTPHDLVLDISPGGDLHVTIVDADTHAPLTARLLVHGLNGTVDPSFGPDYRASGAGPIIDALRGEIVTPLPSGHYRVAATRGIEWSIDAKTVDIAPGRTTDVQLAPRHVVPTPGVLGCDLHVHARPSFDTPVTVEDRVLSLVAAGIEFAVPTEHNMVGDYSTALDTLDLRGELLSVSGVEVTTYSKGFGHFGVFPYPPWLAPPPYKHTTMNAIFRAVRAGDPTRYFQLNHPRLPKGIGYFANIGFDPRAPRSRIRGRVDFDGIEVYNGYDTERPERVEQVLRDYWALLDFGWHYVATGSSDSHRIQFHWAGYPRTMVTVEPHPTAETESKPIDPLVVVANIKKGHAVVTSGPIIELELEGARPGDDAMTTADPLHGHLRVLAAPWVDVTRVDVVVGGPPPSAGSAGVANAATGAGASLIGGAPATGVPNVPGGAGAPLAGTPGAGAMVVQTFEIPPRPTELGPEPGTLEEAAQRTVRFDRDIEVPVGPENTWVQVIARGERRMDDILPFMPVPPLAFTNPIYVVRRPVAPPPFPLTTRSPAPPPASP